MSLIAIVGGGPSQYIPENFYEDVSFWIGADGGAQVLMERGMRVDLAIGDFDSVTSDTLRKIKEEAYETKVYSREKDETDLELAVQEAISKGADHILFYGVTGGRMDHTLANIQLLYPMIQQNLKGTIVDRQNEMEVKLPGVHTVEYSDDYPYVSFIPLSLKVKSLSLQGFKYHLEAEDLPIGSTLCLSNELEKETGTYSFEEGIVLTIKSRDAAPHIPE